MTDAVELWTDAKRIKPDHRRLCKDLQKKSVWRETPAADNDKFYGLRAGAQAFQVPDHSDR